MKVVVSVHCWISKTTLLQLPRGQ